MSFETLAVNSQVTVLSFTDSGSPGSSSYTTIFAVHGLGFNGFIFKKVQALSATKNLRFVAVNRRHYVGSTSYTDAENSILTSGSDTEKSQFIDARGMELASFVDTFIQKHQLPPISSDGSSGGVALLGWSAGNLVTAAAIANLAKLPASTQDRFKVYLRAHIMHEPPSVIFGLPGPPRTWSPHMDASVPPEMHTRLGTQWLTSYFEHGDLSAKGVDAIEYIVPSCRRRPTIYDFSSPDFAEVIDESVVELPGMFMSMPQANAVYRQACYAADLKTLAPRLKKTLIVGDATVSFCITGLLSIRADNEAAGGDIQFASVAGANHFFQWDDPEDALKVYMEAL
ncbi:hypothetical protein C8R44DRAFT_764116 [Mycena epipterygia]|nr:hypothetical protein C8R44DRAFT_764116 [Mycena epipterygia]